MSGFAIVAFQILCPDPGRTAAFYESALSCTRDGRGGTIALGAQRLELIGTAARAGPVAASTSTAFQHFAIVVSDMGEAVARLGAVQGWTAISRAGPERLPASSGGVQAFKFRDPDGHPLEFLCFPPDGMPPAWRGRSGLFLGIDHTAITVADTERSIAFYGRRGFTVSSRGVNRGEEQARMDDVVAPLVEVTGLQPPGGAPPHLELLCYREPGTQSGAVGDEDVLATRMVFGGVRGSTTDDGVERDPDGHRFIRTI